MNDRVEKISNDLIFTNHDEKFFFDISERGSQLNLY